MPARAQCHHRAGAEDDRRAVRSQVLGVADRAERARRASWPVARSPSRTSRRRPFCSRAVRRAAPGTCSTAELVDLWATGSFAKDPPNATVSAFAKDGSKVTDAVVVLRSPKVDGDKLTFDVAGAGRKPRQCRRAGLGVHRHDLVRRRFGGLQLSRHRTKPPAARIRPSAARATPAPSSGWSNPAPSGPAPTAASYPRTTDFGPNCSRAHQPIVPPAVRRRCCPATELSHALFDSSPRRPSLACSSAARRRRRSAPIAAPRPSARRSSRRSCRR